MSSCDILAWKKRLNRKGPFYLLRAEPYQNNNNSDETGTLYVVIWNDKEKTRIGGLHDWMWCRYGIGTRASLNGDRPHDLWNGQWVSNEEFEAMLAVRNGVSNLPKFDLDALRYLSW